MTQEQWKKRNFKPTQLPHNHYWEKTEITDKEFWLKAFCAVATSIGYQSDAIAQNWADKALDYWKAKETE